MKWWEEHDKEIDRDLCVPDPGLNFLKEFSQPKTNRVQEIKYYGADQTFGHQALHNTIHISGFPLI